MATPALATIPKGRTRVQIEAALYCVLDRHIPDLWRPLPFMKKKEILTDIMREMGGGGLGERGLPDQMHDPLPPIPDWINEETVEISLSDGQHRWKYEDPTPREKPVVREPYNPWWKGYVPPPVAEALSRFRAMFG